MSKTRTFLATALSGCLAAGAAQAASCPADKMVPDGMGQKMSTAPAQGVTDTVISSSDFAQQSVGINDRLFRLRRLIVQPGGVVPWHSHADRPAIIYVISGQVTEYASTCAVPICTQGRRGNRRDAWYIALVEERRQAGRAAVHGSVPQGNAKTTT